jgi:hypothetical protein
MVTTGHTWGAGGRVRGAPSAIRPLGSRSETDSYADRDLRPAEAGANVALLTPLDDVVFERTSTRNGVTIAAISQVAADQLTSPGRGPNEAEALMHWMQENEDTWRA